MIVQIIENKSILLIKKKFTWMRQFAFYSLSKDQTIEIDNFILRFHLLSRTN